MAHETFLLELLHVAHLDGETRRVFRNRLCVLDKFGGVEVAGTGVDEVPGKRHRLLFDSDIFCNLLEVLDMLARDNLESHLEFRFLLALVGIEPIVGIEKPVKYCLELLVGRVGEENAHRGDLLLLGAFCQAVGGHAQVVEGRNPAFLCRIDKERRLAVNFQEFEVLERAVLHAVQYGFDLFFTVFRQDTGKLD